ncbi:MAG: HEPN domain-containing protein [Limisphaerales bacterium]
MDETKRAWVRSWLIKSGSDLRSARALLALTEPATDTASYHCQQAAEKALKAFLAYRDRPLERTHDLERLLELAVELDAEFGAFTAHAELLNPYASAYRYPGTSAILFPSVAEIAAAVEQADALCAFVLGKLPGETWP